MLTDRELRDFETDSLKFVEDIQGKANDYDSLLTILINEYKDLKDDCDTLETENNELEGRVEELEGTITELKEQISELLFIKHG